MFMSSNKEKRKLGYLYESLFNLGLLKVLKERKNYFPYWLKEFENYPIREYTLKIFEGGLRTELLESALSRVMFVYFSQGYGFGKKLLEDLGNKDLPVFFYYGKPYPVEDDRDFFLERFTEQYGNLSEEFVEDRKGSLLHADLILHFANKKAHYIAVADLSLFKANELFEGYDRLNREDLYPSGLEILYETDLGAVKGGYLFKPINVKDGGNFKTLLDKLLKLKAEDPEGLKKFFSLLEFKNREVAKLVQASSYAGEYLKLILQKGIIDEKTPVVLRVFGITLHKVAQISFSPKVALSEVLNLLGKAKEVYSSLSGKTDYGNRFMEEFSGQLLEF